jgi:hypothetical protein
MSPAARNAAERRGPKWLPTKPEATKAVSESTSQATPHRVSLRYFCHCAKYWGKASNVPVERPRADTSRAVDRQPSEHLRVVRLALYPSTARSNAS